MPKKRLNIILILVVLGLWGTVAYKSLHRFFPSENDVIGDVNFSRNFNLKGIEKDTFLLEKLNRDPFLDKALMVVKSSPVVLKKTPSVYPNTTKSVPTVKAPLVWPQISYYGYIKSHQKTEELILVKIDNSLHKVRKNQNIGGVIIKRIFKDSIEIAFSKQNKFIYLNH